jgi:hypothetical protein
MQLYEPGLAQALAGCLILFEAADRHAAIGNMPYYSIM